MTAPANAELFAVGPDEAFVTFTTRAGESVTTRVGAREVTTTGAWHVVRVDGLAPDHEYTLDVEGAPATENLPASFRTLACPAGRLLATIATANDVHFGEVECGHLGPPHEDIGPFFSVAPDEPPYPETMNRAVVGEMRALDPDVVVVKGDLTSVGSADEYAAFLAMYGTLGDRMHHVRGNHDAMRDPTMAIEDAPYAVELEGITLAVLDTVIPGTDGGQLSADQVQWLDDLASETADPVLVFGHHYLWDLASPTRNPHTFGINPDDSEALAGVVTRRENIAGYFAGHTHRNRIRRFPAVRDVPFAEIGCTKDYPGAWAEYRIHQGGYTQVVRRATEPAAFAWAEQTRGMFAGLYTEYALGHLDNRCFTQHF
ncbi:MAG: metallophosphoesterase [Acidimicrobiia bacterium]